MRTIEQRLDVGGELLDADVLDDAWVALTRTRFGRQRLFFGVDTSVAVPRRLAFPLVRAAGPAQALLVGARTPGRFNPVKPNGYLVDSTGQVEGVFAFGDGIQDVLVSADEIVVTYFDEGVLEASGTASPAAEGVAVFSFDGELRFGYNSSGLNPDDTIVDCYCAAWGQARRLFFYPYPDFRLVSIDLQTMIHELWPTPSLRGFAALTVGQSVDGREILFFHAPYSAGGPGSGIYRWRIGDDAFEPVGEYPGLLRGLRGGRFLAAGPEGYTIISPGSVE